MSQPALFVPPDDRAAGFYVGEISSVGANGSAPVIWFYPSSNPFGRSDGANWTSVLKQEGDEHVFNGILLLPTATDYRLPGGGTPRTTRSGVCIPQQLRRTPDWYLARAEGVRTFTDDAGNFSESEGLRVQIFDARCTMRRLVHRVIRESDDPVVILDELRKTALESDRIRIFSVYGLIAQVVEVELGKREYPPPSAKPILFATPDRGEDLPKPKRGARAKKRTED